jgi:uncharacterized protein with NRDE domain
MCLIAIARGVSPKWPLVIAANRDEFYARPTRPAQAWDEDPRVIGGRDLRAAGSWLAWRKGGRFAAVTNVRGSGRGEGGPSRGLLVSDFVLGDDPPMPYARAIDGSAYAGFHLIVGDGDVVHCSNAGAGPESVDGIFAISNAAPGSQWEKVDIARDFLSEALKHEVDDDALVAAILKFLGSARGGPIEREVFVASPSYGTRSSTVIILDADDDVLFVEQNYGVGGTPDGAPHRFRIPFMT